MPLIWELTMSRNGPLYLSEKEVTEEFRLSPEELEGIKKKQLERKPSWKEGDRLEVYAHDISNIELRLGYFK